MLRYETGRWNHVPAASHHAADRPSIRVVPLSTEERSMNVLMIDDHPLILSALKSLVGGLPKV